MRLGPLSKTTKLPVSEEGPYLPRHVSFRGGIALVGVTGPELVNLPGAPAGTHLLAECEYCGSYVAKPKCTQCGAPNRHFRQPVTELRTKT